MDAPSIAAEFGGKLALYGGIDVQHLLSLGTPQQVTDQVRANVFAFERRGVYIVANAQHEVDTIREENIVAMCKAVRAATFPLPQDTRQTPCALPAQEGNRGRPGRRQEDCEVQRWNTNPRTHH